MTSDGSWIADKRLFEKNGYHQVQQKDRFELMVKNFVETNDDPKFIDWSQQQKNIRDGIWYIQISANGMKNQYIYYQKQLLITGLTWQ